MSTVHASATVRKWRMPSNPHPYFRWSRVPAIRPALQPARGSSDERPRHLPGRRAGDGHDQPTPDDYRLLAEEVRNMGLLDRRPWYYSVKIALSVAALAGGWVAFFAVGNSWSSSGSPYCSASCSPR